MNKNKLVLSISILLGCIILGGFYYAGIVYKQQAIEKQQQTIIDQNNLIVNQKAECVKEAIQNAQNIYKTNCLNGCSGVLMTNLSTGQQSCSYNDTSSCYGGKYITT